MRECSTCQRLLLSLSTFSTSFVFGPIDNYFANPTKENGRIGQSHLCTGKSYLGSSSFQLDLKMFLVDYRIVPSHDN
jgi:hypothetical protein